MTSTPPASPATAMEGGGAYNRNSAPQAAGLAEHARPCASGKGRMTTTGPAAPFVRAALTPNMSA
jgi:hypothetical protein